MRPVLATLTHTSSSAALFGVHTSTLGAPSLLLSTVTTSFLGTRRQDSGVVFLGSTCATQGEALSHFWRLACAPAALPPRWSPASSILIEAKALS